MGRGDTRADAEAIEVAFGRGETHLFTEEEGEISHVQRSFGIRARALMTVFEISVIAAVAVTGRPIFFHSGAGTSEMTSSKEQIVRQHPTKQCVVRKRTVRFPSVA